MIRTTLSILAPGCRPQVIVLETAPNITSTSSKPPIMIRGDAYNATNVISQFRDENIAIQAFFLLVMTDSTVGLASGTSSSIDEVLMINPIVFDRTRNHATVRTGNLCEPRCYFLGPNHPGCSWCARQHRIHGGKHGVEFPQHDSSCCYHVKPRQFR